MFLKKDNTLQNNIEVIESQRIEVRQTVAAASAERPQERKVRASEGRMPVNGRWRRLQGQCNRNIPPDSSGKGGRAV